MGHPGQHLQQRDPDYIPGLPVEAEDPWGPLTTRTLPPFWLEEGVRGLLRSREWTTHTLTRPLCLPGSWTVLTSRPSSLDAQREG